MKRVFSIVLSLLKIFSLLVLWIVFLFAGQSLAGIFQTKSVVLSDLILLVVLALFCISLLLLIKFAYKITPKQLGITYDNFKQNIRKFFVGGALGIVILAVIVFSLYATGIADININKNISVFAVLNSSLISAYIGFYEEVMFRGFIYNEFIKYNFRFNKAVIILISGIAFAFAHTGNSGFNVLVGVNAILFSAICLVSYISTNNLWLPIGLHAFWDFFEAKVFGVYASGNAPENSFLISKLSGNKLLTGGTFGVEGSAISTFFYIIFLIVMIFYFKKKTVAAFKPQ